MHEKPYTGLKVLDFTRVLAGPYCTMLLGDLGADVVKIELPVVGDPLRRQGPPFHAGDGLTFLACNRNKRSLTLDLKSEQGLRIARSLAERADVLVENFRPDVMTRLGLGYEQLAPTAPGLIYASISGFGSTGPDSSRGAFDLTIQAIGGYMSLTGDEADGPIKLGTSAIDLAAGMHCQSAIGAALLQRLSSGKGQHVETSLLESQVAMLAEAGVAHLHTSAARLRLGAGSTEAAPRKAFATRDGRWVVIDAACDSHFIALSELVGRPSLQRDPRFSTPSARRDHREDLYRLLDPRVADLESSTLLRALTEAKVPCALVHTIAEALEHGRRTRREMVVRLSHGEEGILPQVASPTTFSAFDVGEGWAAPPAVGQHTDDVLADWLAMPRDEIRRLRQAQTV